MQLESLISDGLKVLADMSGDSGDTIYSVLAELRPRDILTSLIEAAESAADVYSDDDENRDTADTALAFAEALRDSRFRLQQRLQIR